MADRALKDWELALLAAYAWTRPDIDRLAGLLSAAYLSAQQRGANRARAALGAATDWTPTREQQRQAGVQGKEDAASIAATYKDLLTGYLLAQSFSSPAEAHAGVASWSSKTAQWKSAQITNWTAGTGNNAGASETVGQALSGDLVDVETGVVIDASAYDFEVQPAESSKDACAEYAGNTYPLGQWDEVPDFPIHGFCPHQKVVSYLT